MPPDRAPRLYRFGPCTYAPALRELRYADVRIVVPLQESKVLTAMLARPDALVSKTELSALLWPNEHYGEFDRAIHNLISKLRRLHPDGAQWIETVPKAGYKLRIAVETEWPEPNILQVASDSPQRAPDSPQPVPDGPQPVPDGPKPVPDSPTSDSPQPTADSPQPTADSPQPTADSPTPTADGPQPAPDARSAAPPAPTAQQLPDAPSLSARPRRTRQAIGAIAVTGIALGAIAWLRVHHRADATVAPAPPTMVGILPFTGSGAEIGEPDALRDQVADALAALPGTEVRAAHSLTPKMSETPEQLQRAAQQLRLDVLVASKLDVQDQSYALSLELIRGADGTHLSSLHYRGNRAGLGALPERIANDIAPLLRHSPGVEPQRMLGSTPNQTAYDLAFRAGAALALRGKADVTEAIALYKRAIEVDPSFARAWAGLAESTLVMANFGDGARTGAQLEDARRAATQALALNPSSSQAHSTLGLILLQHDCKLAEAEHELRSAIRSNPGAAANRLRMAVLLTDEGRFTEASEEIERAHDSDPDWPVVHGTAMYVHIMARAYDRAIADAEALVRAKPDWSRAHQHLGWAYWYAGRHEAAIRAWQRAAVLDNHSSAAALQAKGAQVLDQEGVRAYAELRIAEHHNQPDDDDFVLAEWYAFAGDRAHTLDALENMVHSRNPESLKIPWNPAYDFIREEPRFKRLVAALRARCA